MVWLCTVTTKNPQKFFRDINPPLAEMLAKGEAFTFDEATQEALKKTTVDLPRMPNEDYSIAVTIVKPGRSVYEQKLKHYEN